MTHPVLIVGSMAFDDLELPSENRKDVVGGSATYASIACSLFAKSQLVAVVGDDFPADTLTQLADRGADVTGIERAKGKTFRWAGRYAADLASRETLDTQLNVFADFQPKLPEGYRDARYVMLGNIHPALQLDVLKQANSPTLVVADTMNFWIEGERDKLGEVLAKLDLLVINDEELRQLAGTYNIKRAARKVRDLGPKRLIVKRGEHGAMLFDQDESVFYAPAFPLLNEVDPTGAGDSFAGALMGKLAAEGEVNSHTLRHALLYGAAVASFCVEGVGTDALAALTENQLEERLVELKRMVYIGD